MQVSFEALEQAFAPITKIGQGELTFPVNGIPVTVRLLSPEQEVEVQRYANEALQGEESVATTADYLERFKVAMLSHAIVAVNGLDLRDLDVVETGEVLPNGQKVKIPKVQALRRLVLKWTGSIRIGVFRKYSELIEQIDQLTEKAIEFDPSDLDTEIERLSKRLEELQEVKKKKESYSDQSPVTRMAKALARDSLIEESPGQPEDRTAAAPETIGMRAPDAPPVAAPGVQGRRPILPTQAPPPGATQPVVSRPSQPVVAQSERENPPEYDSFVDSGDQDAMREAIEAENRQLLEARKVAGRPLPGLPPRPVRRPPHMDALETVDTMSEEERAMWEAQQGSLDGVPTFQLPVEDLSQPRMQGNPVRLEYDAAPKGSRNPRFRPNPGR
jgi:hypothetical protein